LPITLGTRDLLSEALEMPLDAGDDVNAADAAEMRLENTDWRTVLDPAAATQRLRIR
jgi:hypothetical protein